MQIQTEPLWHYCFSVCTNTLCTLRSPSTLPPSPLSPFLSEDWTAFCSQGPETQAVSAGNIFHSLGPTGALAATRYGSFQSFILLGKYGSLWTSPLCRLGEAGKDECRWWRQLSDTVWQCACQTAIVTREYDGGGSISINSKRNNIVF